MLNVAVTLTSQFSVKGKTIKVFGATFQTCRGHAQSAQR